MRYLKFAELIFCFFFVKSPHHEMCKYYYQKQSPHNFLKVNIAKKDKTITKIEPSRNNTISAIDGNEFIIKLSFLSRIFDLKLVNYKKFQFNNIIYDSFILFVKNVYENYSSETVSKRYNLK